MDETRTIELARDEMIRWLVAAEARKAARAELRQRGLDVYDADELVNDVVERILVAPLGGDIGNPVGYARRAIANRARDLLRGERVVRKHTISPVTDDEDGGDRDPFDHLADTGGVDPAEDAALDQFEVGLRRALHRELARQKAWVVAAALTTVTLRVHLDVALPDGVPEPDAGSPAKADAWAALWLAGEVTAFPDLDHGRPEDDAMRQARSRKLRAVKQLLSRAVALAGGGDGGGDVDG